MIKRQHPWSKATHHKKTNKAHNGILHLTYPDGFQTSILTEG